MNYIDWRSIILNTDRNFVKSITKNIYIQVEISTTTWSYIYNWFLIDWSQRVQVDNNNNNKNNYSNFLSCCGTVFSDLKRERERVEIKIENTQKNEVYNDTIQIIIIVIMNWVVDVLFLLCYRLSFIFVCVFRKNYCYY